MAPPVVRVAWVSVALLVVLGLLGALTYVTWGATDERDAAQDFEIVYVILGWVAIAGSLLVGALGLWARAPATLATALGIIGAGAFVGAWLTQFVEAGDHSGLHLGMVVAFTGVLVAFAATVRRPA